MRVRGSCRDVDEVFEVAQEVTQAQLSSSLAAASTELRFATAVGVAADALRGNPDAASASLRRALSLAKGSARGLPERREFVGLLERLVQLEGPVVAGR